MTDSINDADRLQALVRSGLLDSPAEGRYDRLTRLVSKALNCPVSLFSLVDKDRQFFKSQIGLSGPVAQSRQTPLTHSFCQYVVASAEPLRINDARGEALVRDNLAVRDLQAIAYLGAPIRSASGHVLGSICAIDHKPRIWTDDELASILDISRLVEEQIETVEQEERWRTILNSVPQMVWSTRSTGYADFYNDRWYEFTGAVRGTTDGDAWADVVHIDDRAKCQAVWNEARRTGETYEIEYRLRHHSGAYRWALGRALPLRGRDGAILRWFGTCTEIDELKNTELQLDLLRHELSHRIQNIFAVMVALASAAARSKPQAREFAEAFSSRIMALSIAHRYVDADPADNADATLRALVEAIFEPYHGGASVSARVVVSGPDLRLAKADQRTALALILHELATNSLKYGSLSNDQGKVLLTIERTENRVEITWREADGPELAAAPSGSGFGSTMIGLALRQINGAIERRWERSGLVVLLIFEL